MYSLMWERLKVGSMAVQAQNVALEAKEEDCEFRASLSYIVGPLSKQNAGYVKSSDTVGIHRWRTVSLPYSDFSSHPLMSRLSPDPT